MLLGLNVERYKIWQLIHGLWSVVCVCFFYNRVAAKTAELTDRDSVQRCIDSAGPNKPCVRRRCKWTPPGEYDWTIRARWRCALSLRYHYCSSLSLNTETDAVHAADAEVIFPPGRSAKHCSESVCLSVCLFARIGLSRKLSGRTFRSKFYTHADCDPVSVLLWRQCGTLCTSDVLFSHMAHGAYFPSGESIRA